MSVGDVIDSINMILLSGIALLLIRVLIRQKKVKPLESILPNEPGEIVVDGSGRRWEVTGSTFDVFGPGTPHRLRLDLVEVRP